MVPGEGTGRRRKGAKPVSVSSTFAFVALLINQLLPSSVPCINSHLNPIFVFKNPDDTRDQTS